MAEPVTRRTFTTTSAVGLGAAAITTEADAGVRSATPIAPQPEAWIVGRRTGAQAIVEALVLEGTDRVFGIPGAQENELWDVMKQMGLPYLLVTHEASASAMADAVGRTTGRPGVMAIVPGPGVTNALTGLGEALLDSSPIVCLVGDVAQGEKHRPFQVHELPNADLLRPVCKQVLCVDRVEDIPGAVRSAFRCAMEGEPGPVAVLIPYPLLIESADFRVPPPPPVGLSCDDAAIASAINLMSAHRGKIGIYAGAGCQSSADLLTQVACMLGSPVATSVSGKGVIDELHPLAVGWGYGPQGTKTAEETFQHVDLVLAIGVKYSEVSTAFYSQPKRSHLIHVDACRSNLGRVMPADVCVHADAGLFLTQVCAAADRLSAPSDRLKHAIAQRKRHDRQRYCQIYAKTGVDPMAFILQLRRFLCDDALTFVDVTLSEHWAAEAFTTRQPRTYFNPVDNQSMGWSIPAAIGAQVVFPGRQVVTITGDGCFMMSAIELSTAAREQLPVKFFVFDDQAYHYMQRLQKRAYRRTTATALARLDYAAFAQAMGVCYQEILSTDGLVDGIRQAVSSCEPTLIRVVVDYRERPVRWVNAVADRYIDELDARQRIRLLSRLGGRSLNPSPLND